MSDEFYHSSNLFDGDVSDRPMEVLDLRDCFLQLHLIYKEGARVDRAGQLRVPHRGETITVRFARGGTRPAVVRAFNYFFERIDGVYVDYLDEQGGVDQLVWLHQIEPV